MVRKRALSRFLLITTIAFDRNTCMLRPDEEDIEMANRVSGYILSTWNFLFNHEVSPVRNIPDIAIRHYVLQALGLMWATSFSLAIGSYAFFAASVVGHTVLIAAAAITVATLTSAAARPQLFVRGLGRIKTGEHD